MPKENKKPELKDLFRRRNQLEVPEWAKKDIEKQGLEYRWIDSVRLKANGNMHQNYWEVYIRPEGMNQKDVFGLPPDGTIRRGTVVLAVRPKEVGDAHRMDLQERANRLKSFKRSQAQRLKQEMRRAGIETPVHEGFDDK